MFKNNLKNFTMLNKLHEQEQQFKRELSKTFLEYLDNLPSNKRIEQMESLLYEKEQRNLPTLDRRLTFQERKCLHLASQGKEIKEAANILGLSQRTIKYHRANIIKKLDVPNLMAAIGRGNQYCNTNKDDFYETILNIMDCNFYWKNKDGLIDDLPGDIYWKRCVGKKLIYAGMNRTGTDSLHKMGFRWKINDIIGKTDDRLFDKETADTFIRNDWEVINEGVARTKEETAILPSGKKIIQLSTKRPL